MISSRALNDQEICFRNYVAMSFYLLDAFDSDREFSLLGYAMYDGLSFTNLDYSEFTYVENLDPSGEYYSSGQFNSLNDMTCPVCGNKMFVKYDHVSMQNEAYCETDLCNDVLAFFGFSLWNSKGKNQSSRSVKRVARIVGLTPSTVARKINLGKYVYEISSAMSLVFLLEATNDPKIANSKFYSFREIDNKYGIKSCNLVKSQNANQTLYGIKFPTAIYQDYEYYVPKHNFYEWAKNCNREILI